MSTTKYNSTDYGIYISSCNLPAGYISLGCQFNLLCAPTTLLIASGRI